MEPLQGKLVMNVKVTSFLKSNKSKVPQLPFKSILPTTEYTSTFFQYLLAIL
jgi:hypothetical protein